MKFSIFTCLLNIILIFGLTPLIGQTVIRGEVKDEKSSEPLILANVFIKGTTEGVTTEYDGTFELRTAMPLPLTLVFSYTGYDEKELEVTSATQRIVMRLPENSITISTIEVKGQRISDKQKQSALTVESLDNIAIKQTPAASFYDGLGSLKDVDLTAASLGFKIVNTRGFNSTSPVRSLQIIDGVDNQSPGLNFSLGNFLGASELDVNRVNLVVGASSAFYGPNAFNGVISMETRDPFLQKGLSVMLKAGERSLLEGGIRWADALKNKDGLEHIAYKFNVSGFSAYDWEADNYDVVFDSQSAQDNPGGYDAVNIYGDEFVSGNEYPTIIGMGSIHRRGYREKDLVDYNSRNVKVGLAAHFRLNPAKSVESPTLILASNFSTGTTVYQGDNRYSLRNIRFYQHRLELKKEDKYFFRVYATHEDAGDSYDPYFTALQLQENAKEGQYWSATYIAHWQTQIVPKINSIDGLPRISQFPGDPQGYRDALNAFLANPMLQDSLQVWHRQAQEVALKADALVEAVDYYEPGTQRFQQAFDDITSRVSYAEGGTRFFDKSALIHAHGEYKFNDLYQGGSISDLDIVVGANGRQYLPDSQGSILLDTAGRKINTYEFGLYGGGTLEFNNRLKFSASIRMDKNQNFDYLFSPAASLVYTPNPNNTLRLSFSSAIRNPTLADQYLFYNVGRAILLGNIDGVDSLVTIESLRDYLNTNNTSLLDYFSVDPIRPEKVQTVEAGYRTTLFDRLYLDATYYYSFYQDFIGYNIGVDAFINTISGGITGAQAYRVAANATDRVTTQGFSIGASLYFSQYYSINGNYSWNKLNTETDDPIVPAFNTPEHKYNIGLSGRDITLRFGGTSIPNFGFSVNYKWIDEFIFEGSPQFTGVIPSYDMLDAQINVAVNKLNTTFKLGASNILDNKVFQTYGGPRIGRLAYISAVYEFKKK